VVGMPSRTRLACSEVAGGSDFGAEEEAALEYRANCTEQLGNLRGSHDHVVQCLTESATSEGRSHRLRRWLNSLYTVTNLLEMFNK
jgi:hypothetical protein